MPWQVLIVPLASVESRSRSSVFCWGPLRDGRRACVQTRARRLVVERRTSDFLESIQSTAVHPFKSVAHPARVRLPVLDYALEHKPWHEIGDGPIAGLAVDELALCLLAGGNVLDLRDEIQRLAGIVAHQRDR